ncbi:hypothetical protein [Jannaschia pohangensis]|uniref:Uncharacterized protein n=1 Tax=Jannaschia pohangensis TaxID=390807 RepID=A0A1I3IY01_9RHOB|nr:hypothetical protein [Jannaschia pohangensis]SFI52851.1 hypothetical protein SAMN04488095_1141 [Jannaschia pohangensis]
MPKKNNTEEGVGVSARGGVHSSRARRLSDRVEQNSGSKGFGAVPLSLGAVIVAIGAVSFLSLRSDPAVDSAADTPIAAVSIETPALDATPSPVAEIEIEAPTQDVALIEASPDTPAASDDPVEVVATASVTEATPEAAPLRNFTTSTIACVAAVEFNLMAMERGRSTATVSADWSSRQQQVTDLVQKVLDCPQAGFQVVGSLQLLEVGLADLEVIWDRDTAQLELRTVARASLDPARPTQDPAETGADADALPWTNFTMR